MSSPPHDTSPVRSDRSFSASRRDAGSLVVDDLLQGMHEWRNIQDVIRSTFKALHDVIKAQGDAVKSLERQLEGKASSADVQAALQRKANIADVNRSISDIAHSLETKALISDLDNKPDREEVQASLKGKAGLAEMTSELEKKADRDEIENFRLQVEKHLNDLSLKLEEQAREVERRALKDDVTFQLMRKLDITPFEEKFGSVGPHRTVAQILYNKVDNAVLDKTTTSMMEEMKKLQTELRYECQSVREVNERHNENISKLSMRLDAVDGDMYASKTSQHKQSSELQIKMEALSREVAQLSNNHQGSSSLLLEMKSLISQNNTENSQQMSKVRSDCKVEISEMENALGFKMKTEIAAARDQFERRLMDTVQEIDSYISQTARKDDVLKALSNKVDRSEMDERIENLKTSNRRILDNLEREVSMKADKSALDKKIGYDAMDESLAIQEQALQRVVAMMDGIHKEMEQKYKALDEEVQERANRMETIRKIEQCLTETEELKRDLRRKADIKEVNLLVDSKADVDEVNRALLDVNGQLSLKASMADISSTLHEQVMLNSALITELCLGRWIWKSLKTKNGGLIPWNIQTANSDPTNLIWEKDKTFIICGAPGLYEIQFGIFSRKKPTVKVQVNGDPILTISPQSSIQQHSGARLHSSGRFTNSNITGLTHIDFLALPSRARVSIAYQGDEDAEAFLGLRKL